MKEKVLKTREEIQMIDDEAFTVFHHGFPPMVIFGGEKLAAWIDAVKQTVSIESIQGREMSFLNIRFDNEADTWTLVG